MSATMGGLRIARALAIAILLAAPALAQPTIPTTPPKPRIGSALPTSPHIGRRFRAGRPPTTPDPPTRRPASGSATSGIGPTPTAAVG